MTIRGEPHTVLSAIQRQVAHYSGHVYQLVLIVKTLRGDQWQTLSIPRGESVAYTAEVQAAQAAISDPTTSARPVAAARAYGRVALQL
ncbi:DUF1572 family protein [Deinococcus malanensis]|uniref:DUF1572 family protein n=1 Tax=Deinococcus malanensis TaxID=1706855 RepID=UPI0036277E95